MSETSTGFVARFFELRMIVAVLFAIYGVVCTVWGLGFTTADEIRRAAGFNVNLLAGVGMLIAAAGFATWALARPLVQAQTSEGEPPT